MRQTSLVVAVHERVIVCGWSITAVGQSKGGILHSQRPRRISYQVGVLQEDEQHESTSLEANEILLWLDGGKQNCTSNPWSKRQIFLCWKILSWKISSLQIQTSHRSQGNFQDGSKSWWHRVDHVEIPQWSQGESLLSEGLREPVYKQRGAWKTWVCLYFLLALKWYKLLMFFVPEKSFIQSTIMSYILHLKHILYQRKIYILIKVCFIPVLALATQSV